MWEHPATVANVATLRSRGVVVLDPAVGRLTGQDSGPGRLPEPEEIYAAARRLLRRPDAAPDLFGLTVVVSAGGTREPLDPVRYLGNRSSGLQGHALAGAAAARGARVVLITTSSLPTPAGVRRVDVESALQLREAVRQECAGGVDVVVMAAAVADFRPAEVAVHKIKKEHEEGAQDAPTVALVRNPDVLAELVRSRRDGAELGVIVGFAAETGDADGDVLTHARAKLARKGCDLLVVNDVSAGKVFGRTETEVCVLDAAGGVHPVPPGSKDEVAEAVWDAVVAWRCGDAR
jgi:phosphopantothenoylcysteine decarboxylase/phosphopantothenate--cysteine ligase